MRSPLFDLNLVQWLKEAALFIFSWKVTLSSATLKKIKNALTQVKQPPAGRGRGLQRRQKQAFHLLCRSVVKVCGHRSEEQIVD
jgi:hypothetical protein